MATIKKFNLQGEAVGDFIFEDSLLEVQAHPQMVKDYIVALRANARQWSANTKGRSEVKHSTKKPHRQKGTGSARQGSLVAPQYRGGGIVFGPKPKFDQHVRINKKERRLAIHSLFIEKFKEGRIIVVEDNAFSSSLKAPKTKTVAQFLQKQGIKDRSVLFVAESEKKAVDAPEADFFKLSLRNIPKTSYTLSANVSGYDLIAASHLVLTEKAARELASYYR